MFQAFFKNPLPLVLTAASIAPFSLASADVTVHWNDLGISKQISTWSAATFGIAPPGESPGAAKPQARSEKDPATGKVVKWEGALLASVIEEAVRKLPAEQMSSRVDLLVFKTADGAKTVVPRMLATRWPLLLAWKKDGKPLAQPTVVIPWTSKPQILSASDGVPLERFFVAGLAQVELANSKERYGSLFLKRRTDPSAVRGEKLFVQGCMSCHTMGEGPAFTGIEAQGSPTRRLASETSHPSVRGMKSMNDRDRRALKSYLDAYASENPSGAAGTAVSAKR